MNLVMPVSKIMTTQLLTVSPDDPMALVKEIFDNNRIHHIPVVRLRRIVGIISKSDFQSFYNCLSKHFEDRFINDTLMRLHKTEEIMTRKLAKVSPEDHINVAIEVFKENILHALPVVNEQNELVGIITTHDIIKLLARDKIKDADYYQIV
jgi:acetoin utilization protein AcuB